MAYYDSCMEERAFKSSFHRELAMRAPVQPLFFEDNNGGDDFSVDSFLNFSNSDEFKDGLQETLITNEEEEEEEEEEKDSVDDNISNSSLSDSSFTGCELYVPEEDITELEWVSQFVDDSPLEFSPLCPEKKTESHAINRFEPEPKPALTKRVCIFPFAIPAKARTKRPRPSGLTWSVNDSQSTSSSTSSSSITSCLGFINSFQTVDFSSEPPRKKQKKRPVGIGGETGGSVQLQRRCSHCQVQKTPQWRTGPLGAKTLCNACGVRFKSGRLFPEYRPACSPSFSSDMHSNCHRKVLEMRKKKEMESNFLRVQDCQVG